MSSFVSDDDHRDVLQIKPPQAYSREKKKDKERYHHSRSKSKDHRDKDSRSRNPGRSSSSRHESRHDESGAFRQRGSSDHRKHKRKYEHRRDGRQTLEDREEKRRTVEEEEARMYAKIARRNLQEEREETKRHERQPKEESPEQLKMDTVGPASDEDYPEPKRKHSFLPEVEDIEQSSPELDDDRSRDPHSDSHASDTHGDDDDDRSRSDGGARGASVRSRSRSNSLISENSGSESEVDSKSESSKSSRSDKEAQNGNPQPDPTHAASNGLTPETSAIEQEMKNNAVLDIPEWKETENALSLLPPYYPAIQGCRRVEEFHFLNRIEEGTYGVVFRAKDKRTNEVVALKRLKMEKEKDGFPITSLREINTLLKAQHENIVTVREIVVGSNTDKIFLVMDYVEHDLKSLMETLRKKDQAFMMGEVKCLMIQLLRAVAHLHDNWILHRDLKTSNLLLSHKGILKVGDFGLAREYGSPLKAYTSIVVTLWYRAPELLLGQKIYSCPIDVWSVGCIFGELVKMEPIFQGKSEPNQLNLIFQTLGTPNDRIWPGYKELPLLQKMTFADYPVNKLKTRFSILSESGIDLMNKFLTFNPEKRITAEDALKHPFFEEPPLPIDPSVFPTWPAKSESGGHRMAPESPKPPSGGRQFKDLRDDDGDTAGFFLGDVGRRQGGGFNLKF